MVNYMVCLPLKCRNVEWTFAGIVLINLRCQCLVKISHKLILTKSNNMRMKFKSGLYVVLFFFVYHVPGQQVQKGDPGGAEEDGKTVLPLFHRSSSGLKAASSSWTWAWTSWTKHQNLSWPVNSECSLTWATSLYEQSTLNWYLDLKKFHIYSIW